MNNRQQKTTWLYRVLSRCKILTHERYRRISLWRLIILVPKTLFTLLIYQYSYLSIILEPLNFKWLRARCWRILGCNVGRNVGIGRRVEFDYGNSKMITIGNNILIGQGCTLLCHKRDNSLNYKGCDPSTLPYIYEPITICDNAQIGINTTIMPGVTIGESAVIGAGSLVVKDIPAWSIAIGSPAKVVKELPDKLEHN